MHIPFRPLKEKNATSFLTELLAVISVQSAYHPNEICESLFTLNEIFIIYFSSYIYTLLLETVKTYTIGNVSNDLQGSNRSLLKKLIIVEI